MRARRIPGRPSGAAMDPEDGQSFLDIGRAVATLYLLRQGRGAEGEVFEGSVRITPSNIRN